MSRADHEFAALDRLTQQLQNRIGQPASACRWLGTGELSLDQEHMTIGGAVLAGQR